MALVLTAPYPIPAFGLEVEGAYVRIQSVTVGTVHDVNAVAQRGPLLAAFEVYASAEARWGGRSPIGGASVIVTDCDINGDLFAQAWAGLAAEGEPWASALAV